MDQSSSKFGAVFGEVIGDGTVVDVIFDARGPLVYQKCSSGNNCKDLTGISFPKETENNPLIVFDDASNEYVSDSGNYEIALPKEGQLNNTKISFKMVNLKSGKEVSLFGQSVGLFLNIEMIG